MSRPCSRTRRSRTSWPALALALAANSTIFAVLDAIVLRPYRFEGIDRLIVAASSDPQQGIFDRESVSPADFRDWSAAARSISAGTCVAKSSA